MPKPLKAVLEVFLEKQRQESQRIPHNLPYTYSGVTKFVGRETELETLHRQLHQNDRVAISVIEGMGGIGKTELALQYAAGAWQSGTYSGGVCWLRAREEVGTQIISFALKCLDLTPPEGLELAEKVTWCWGHWREGDTLLIFDDVQDYATIKPLLEGMDLRFKILMTTRSRFGSSVQELQLDVLSKDQALALLRSLVKDDRIDQQLDEAKQLCEWLGYLPLGLELAGRYLARKQDLSLAQLWQRLQDKRLEARAFKQAEPGMTASLGVAAAFELSWQDLEESAQQLAIALSLFALAGIPWTMVEQCLPDEDTEELEEIRDEQLVGTHLLKRVDKGIYQLHQLLKEFFVSKREQTAVAEALKQEFCRVMSFIAEQFPLMITASIIEQLTPLIPHFKEAATTLKPWLADADIITPSTRIARFYHEQSAFVEAEEWYEQCQVISEQRLGSNHLNTATSFHNLAGLYYTQGRFEDSEAFFSRALVIRENQLGENHLDVATSLAELGVVLEDQGRYTEAERFCKRALTIREQQLGEDHLDVAASLNNLALLYQDQKNYEEAERLYKKSLIIKETISGVNDLAVATSLSNLANLYYVQKKYKEAECSIKRSLKIREHQLEESHPSIAKNLNSLAAIYLAQGRHQESEELAVRALKLKEHLLGEDHPAIATSLNNLAKLFTSQERYGEAERFYARSLEIKLKKLDKDHLSTQRGWNNFRVLLLQV